MNLTHEHCATPEHPRLGDDVHGVVEAYQQTLRVDVLAYPDGSRVVQQGSFRIATHGCLQPAIEHAQAVANESLKELIQTGDVLVGPDSLYLPGDAVGARPPAGPPRVRTRGPRLADWI
ncbi:hypothetical protein CKO28_04990 [Rhodovibrio sodomensis]|uniref:Uncharacterized protein n=1 Tax=Rhodovibrio sodomensis TaxID=1088 RepID=A0ABS1DBV7_9PROT|nr:hypothetical protein [Rhodovibrio sodomensis]MBK1667384.1 hypothetical protein [Rhodovibrio sodomensis]